VLLEDTFAVPYVAPDALKPSKLSLTAFLGLELCFGLLL